MPEFKVGDRVRVKDTVWVGTVVFVLPGEAVTLQFHKKYRKPFDTFLPSDLEPLPAESQP